MQELESRSRIFITPGGCTLTDGRFCPALLLEKILLNLLRQKPSIFGVCMGIKISYHTCLRMTRVTLYRFDITAADLELHRGTTMPQTVKNDRWQIILFDKVAQAVSNLTFLKGTPIRMGEHHIEVCVGIAQGSFQIILLCLHAQ